jgi:hypothetical protein
MQTTILRCLGIGLLLVAPGCAPWFGWPDLLHPGSFAYQRWKAERFDPYPATDVGPMGSPAAMRPPWYETPVPLANRDIYSLTNRFGPEPPKESPVMP